MLARFLRSMSRSSRLKVEPPITTEDRFVLQGLLQESLRPQGIVLEVGSFLGHGSTRTLVDVVQSKRGTLYCVDTWQGSLNVPRHRKLAQTHDLFAAFRHNVAVAGGAELVKPLVMPSRDAARIFADGIADLIFIDGDHSYSSVRQDIAMWWPKVRKGGILCGHDCEGRPEEFGHDRILTHREQDFIYLDGHRFAGCHPGPVLAVAELGEAAVLWAQRSLAEYGFGEARSTIWHLRVS